VLDDLQWAGPDALDLLSALVRSQDQPPLRLACAYRNSDVGQEHQLAALLADLAQARLAAQWELGPLESEVAADLLTALFNEGGIQDESGMLRSEVARRAGGVPFFLVSCAEAVRPQVSGESTHETPIPWDITQSISQRVATLPAPARELLAAAAVL